MTDKHREGAKERRLSTFARVALSSAFLVTAPVIPVSLSSAHAAQEGCPAPEENEELAVLLWAFCAKAYGGVEVFDLPGSGYLGFENLLTNILDIGVVTADERITATTVGAEFEAVRYTSIDENYKTGILFRGGFNYSNGSESQTYNSIDPGAGFGLGIPGVTGGPSGAFLTANPQNIVEDARYDVDLNWGQVFANVESRHEADDHAYGYYAGIRYSWLNLDQRFHGAIPGFLSDFAYNTELDTRSYGVHVGIRGRKDVFEPLGGVWQPQVSLRAEAGLAYIDADLDDSLAWNGFIAGNIANSHIQVSDDEVAPYSSVGAALSLTNKATATQFFVDAQYDYRPWFGTAVRDGTNPTRYESEGAKVITVTGGMRLRF